MDNDFKVILYRYFHVKLKAETVNYSCVVMYYFKILSTFFYVSMCVHVYGGPCATTHVWKLEDNLWELILSFLHMGFETEPS